MNRCDLRWSGVALFSMGVSLGWVTFGQAAVASDAVHDWERITFPSVEVGKLKTHVNFVVIDDEHSRGLRFDILISGGSEMPQLFVNDEIRATIVRENGVVAEPLDGNPLRPVGGAGSAGGLTWATMVWFPWGEDPLSAAWVRVAFAAEVVWLELPYGFDQNPATDLFSSKEAEAPQRPVALDGQEVVQWRTVIYDFGGVQNDWRLSLMQSNPVDAVAEVVLYREDSAVGKSMFLWDLHEPRTDLRIIESDGDTVGGMCRELRLHDDAPADLANRLTLRLKEWTGRAWIISVTSEHEGEETVRDARAREVMAHPMVQKALELFPDAKVTAIREADAIAAPEPESDEEDAPIDPDDDAVAEAIAARKETGKA